MHGLTKALFGRTPANSVMSELHQFNAYLSGVDLAKYRQKYSRIKLVELDLDRDIQAIRHLYREYWEKRANFANFEKFYQIYHCELTDKLEKFRKDKMFSKETFYRGLPARIYRTWASLLTQIQGGYVAEQLYGRGNVEMSADLDYAGIDMKFNTPDGVFDIQIKKETLSREVRAPWQTTKRGKPIIMITYEVPGCDPLTSTGKPSVPFKRWKDKWAGKLDRLDNGFIVFASDMFSLENIKTP